MIASAFDHFVHVAVGTGDRTLFLLHGTGADEHDLLPLAEGVRDTYTLVGLRGNVMDDGMRRFFHRLPSGAFDQKSIREEVDKLAAFLTAWYAKFHVSVTDVAFLGYSNGANMLLALAFLHPELVSTSVCLHCTLPFVPASVDLSGKKFLVTYGEADSMIPAADTKRVVSMLRSLAATVTVVAHAGGHEIWPSEIVGLETFLQR